MYDQCPRRRNIPNPLSYIALFSFKYVGYLFTTYLWCPTLNHSIGLLVRGLLFRSYQLHSGPFSNTRVQSEFECMVNPVLMIIEGC